MDRSGSFNVDDDLRWRYVSRCQHGDAAANLEEILAVVGLNKGRKLFKPSAPGVISRDRYTQIPMLCQGSSTSQTYILRHQHGRNVCPDDQSGPSDVPRWTSFTVALAPHVQSLALYLLLQACIPGQYTEKHSSLHLLPRNIHTKPHSAWITTPQITMRLFRSSVE